MNKILSKWQALSTVILGIALIAILTVFPLRLWLEPIEEVSNRIQEGTVKLVKDGPAADQMFVAQYDHLDGLDFLVTDASEDASFVLRVYDENHILKREQVYFADKKGPFSGRVYVFFNLDTKIGKQYYYSVECIRGYMQLAYEVTETSGFIYSGPSHVGEEALGGCNLITGYRYAQPLRKGKSALAVLSILAVAFFLVAMLRMISRKTGKLTDIVTLQWGVKAVCNPCIIVGTIAGFLMVGPMYMFSYQYVDIAVFVLGVLFLGMLLWNAVNRTYARSDQPFNWDYIADRLPHVLQSLCLAMALLACIHYMNGLYEVFHDIAYREMLVWLALSMIVTYPAAELINWWNAAGLLASALWAFRYYRMGVPEVANEYELRVLKLTCYLAVLLTIVVIHTVRVLVGRKVRHVNLFYAFVTAALTVGMICMRNERWWPVMMAAAFSLFGIYYAAWDKKDRFLNNVLNGILFNFAGCTLFCLLHRPYMSFKYTRYPQMFHTVTVTATYLAVVMSAAAVKLFYKYNREKKWKACFYEIVILGTVSCYVLFTMSRTGMIGVAAMGIATWLVSMDGRFGERVRKLLSSAMLVLFSVLLLFPVCFTCQRIIPAVVRQPVEYDEIEHFPDTVFVGEDLRSDDYITMDRFVEIFADKMLGIPEDTIVLYHYRIGNDPLLEQQSGGNRRPAPVPWRDDDDQGIDFTNGRVDIYKSYIEQLTMEGHEEMGAVLQDGTLAMHAHNIYLQFAFDHGIIMGIAFIVWMLITWIYTILYFYKSREKNSASALPLSMLVLFAVAGVVEWIAHPCNPAGFVFLLILMPLLFDDTNLTASGSDTVKRRKEKNERKKKTV